MADHSELIAELPRVEKMATPDRLKHAKRRRLEQMKKWSQREKDYIREVNAKKKKTDQNNQKKVKKNDYKVHFVPSVMLLEAAARGDIEEVKRLLMLGVNPDSTNEDGLTALHQCCIDNNEDMMKLLIEFHANVNAEDSERWTPLHAASTCGHLNLVKYLISKKANLLAVNADGNMPYDICEDETTLDYIESEMSKRGVTQELIDETRAATEKVMLDDIKWLAQKNSNLEYCDAHGATPLHIAAANGYYSVVELLLDQNVSTDAVDTDMWQPIHAAACWGHLEVLELLVQNGANLEAKTKNGETPFDICEDADMKDRMLELKNEMAIKQSTQPQRLKRSQSNTRSRSVRRTSRRDKTHMTQQEVREEAHLWLVHQGMNADVDNSTLEVKYNRENTEKDLLQIVDPGHINMVVEVPQNIMNVTPQSKPDQSVVEGCELNDNKKIDKSIHGIKQEDSVLKKRKETNENGSSTTLTRPSPSPSPSPGIVPPSPLDLSVPPPLGTAVPFNNSGSSTLAELKRQRMDQRKMNGAAVAEPGENKMNGHKSEPNHIYEPPSPSISMRKFTGLTADDSMLIKKKHNCCVIL